MGLFDTSQNIESIQLSLILKRAVTPDNVWLFGDSCFWFVEESHNHTDTGPMSETHYVDFNTVCDYYKDIRPVMEYFDENFDTLQINMGSDKSIPTQLGDIMRSYLPKDSNIKINPSELFIAFNNKLSRKFANIYENYMLRYKFGQRGFDMDPEKIGYFHCQFESEDSYDNYLRLGDHEKIVIHYFCPFAMVEPEK
jgi:hypothetical protein